jgi:protein TonB
MRNYGSMDQTKSRNINNYDSGSRGRQVILIAFLLSITAHASAMIAFQGIFPLPWFSGKPRAYKVYLMRPPIKEIMKSNKESRPAIIQIHSEPPGEKGEATISLDTMDSAYHPYTRVLKDRILTHWIYPLAAQRNLIQGSLLIVFRLDRGGNLIDCNIARSSGHDILDTHALEAIRSADPFPPFPEDIKVQALNINASFAYQLRFEQ